MDDPEPYWDALLKTREHLAEHHSYRNRFRQLEALVGESRSLRRGAMNILFVMKHRGNAGNTHAVANYMRVAPKHGHSVAIFGTPIWYVPELKFSMDIAEFDRVIYLFETELYRLKPLHEATMLDEISKAGSADPRHGRYVQSSSSTVDGYDFNHSTEADRAQWIAYIDALGDRVVQTLTTKPPQSEGERAVILRL